MKLTLIFLFFAGFLHGQSFVNDIGRYHNEGLAFVKPKIAGKPFSITFISQTVHDFVTTKGILPNSPLDLTHSEVFETIISAPGTSFQYIKGYCEQLFGRDNLPSLLQEMLTIEQIMQKPRTGTKAAIYTQLVEDLTKAKSKSTNLQVTALYNIGLASAEFWNLDPNVTPEGLSIFWKADCVGYIVSWSLAFHEDAVTGEDSGAEARMRKGLYGAIKSSTGGLVRL